MSGMAKMGGKRTSTKGGATVRDTSRGVMRCCVVADTTIMSPRFSISCTAGCMSICSCTMQKMSYLFKRTMRENFFLRDEFNSIASLISLDVPLDVLSRFYEEQDALSEMQVSPGLLHDSVKDNALIITHQPRLQKNAPQKKKMPSTWKSKMRKPSGADVAGIGQYCLVMRGATIPFKTVEESSGERPFNNSINCKVPVIFHTTSVPSTFNVTVEGISMRSWKSVAWGQYMCGECVVSSGCLGKSSTVFGVCPLGSTAEVSCIMMSGWSNGLGFASIVSLVGLRAAKCGMGHTADRLRKDRAGIRSMRLSSKVAKPLSTTFALEQYASHKMVVLLFFLENLIRETICFTTVLCE